MPRTARTRVELNFRTTLRNFLEDGRLTTSVINRPLLSGFMRSGIEENQSNRAWEDHNETILSGNTVDIDLHDFAGIDHGAGDGKDALGQPLTLEEIVCLVIRQVSGPGRLEIMPSMPTGGLTWVQPQTVANGGALKANGIRLLYEQDADALDIIDGFSHVLRLGANGGDVEYEMYVAARHDDNLSSSQTLSVSFISPSSQSSPSSLTSLSTSSSQSEVSSSSFPTSSSSQTLSPSSQSSISSSSSSMSMSTSSQSMSPSSMSPITNSSSSTSSLTMSTSSSSSVTVSTSSSVSSSSQSSSISSNTVSSSSSSQTNSTSSSSGSLTQVSGLAQTSEGDALLQPVVTWVQEKFNQMGNPLGPDIELITEQSLGQPAGYDSFRITQTGNTVQIISDTHGGAHHGAATLIQALGYYSLAGGDNWQIQPQLGQWTLPVEFQPFFDGVPSSKYRSAFLAYGHPASHDVDIEDDRWDEWKLVNRLQFDNPSRQRYGHSWKNIIGRNQASWDANPNWLMTNPATMLRDLPYKVACEQAAMRAVCVQDRINLMNEGLVDNPYTFMVSIDPSDGVTPDPIVAEQAFAGAKAVDHIFILANEVAAGLVAVDPTWRCSMYGYGAQDLPPDPSVGVHPSISMQIALGFNNTGLSLPALLDTWNAVCTDVSLREYYSVEAWDWGQAGRAKGNWPDYINTLRGYFNNNGAQGINGEFNTNWMSTGCGMWCQMQAIWDFSLDDEDLKAQWLLLAFPGVENRIRPFVDFITTRNPARSASQYVEAHQAVDSAWSNTSSTEVKNRLLDCYMWLHYSRQIELAQREEQTNQRGSNYYNNFLFPMMNYAHRIRKTSVIHYYALARRLCNQQPISDGFPQFSLSWSPDPVWRDYTAAPDEAEILSDAVADLAAWQAEAPQISYTGAITRVSWTGAPTDVCRATRDPVSPDGKASLEVRKIFRAHLWLTSDTVFDFYPNNQSATVEIIQFDENGSAIVSFSDQVEEETPNPQPPIPYIADGTLEEVTLRAGKTTLYVNGGTFIRYDPDLWVTWLCTPESSLWNDQCGPLHFRVPLVFEGAAFPWKADGNPRLSVFMPGEQGVPANRRDLGGATRQPDGWSHINIQVDPTTPHGGWAEMDKNSRGACRIETLGYVAARGDRLALPLDFITEEGLTPIPD